MTKWIGMFCVVLAISQDLLSATLLTVGCFLIFHKREDDKDGVE